MSKCLFHFQTFPEKERRQKIVARLPNITKLNGSPIYEQEREEAERAYIRQFLDEEVKPKRLELDRVQKYSLCSPPQGTPCLTAPSIRSTAQIKETNHNIDIIFAATRPLRDPQGIEL